MNDRLQRDTILAALEVIRKSYGSPVRRDAVDEIAEVIMEMPDEPNLCLNCGQGVEAREWMHIKFNVECAHADGSQPPKFCQEIRGVKGHLFTCILPFEHDGEHEFRLGLHATRL